MTCDVSILILNCQLTVKHDLINTILKSRASVNIYQNESVMSKDRLQFLRQQLVLA